MFLGRRMRTDLPVSEAATRETIDVQAAAQKREEEAMRQAFWHDRHAKADEEFRVGQTV